MQSKIRTAHLQRTATRYPLIIPRNEAAVSAKQAMIEIARKTILLVDES